MINKRQYTELRDTFRDVIVPGIRKGILTVSLKDLWLTTTKYDKVVFAEPIFGTKQFPDTWSEIGQIGVLNLAQVTELYYKLRAKNFL